MPPRGISRAGGKTEEKDSRPGRPEVPQKVPGVTVTVQVGVRHGGPDPAIPCYHISSLCVERALRRISMRALYFKMRKPQPRANQTTLTTITATATPAPTPRAATSRALPSRDRSPREVTLAAPYPNPEGHETGRHWPVSPLLRGTLEVTKWGVPLHSSSSTICLSA